MKHVSVNHSNYLIRDLQESDIEFLAKYWAESPKEYWQSKGVDLDKVGTFEENKKWFTGYVTGERPASSHIVVIAQNEKPVIYSLYKPNKNEPNNMDIVMNFNVMKPSIRNDPKLMKPFFLELIAYLCTDKNLDCSRLMIEVATTDIELNKFLPEELALSPKMATLENPSGIAMSKNLDFCIYEDFSPLLKLHQQSSPDQEKVEEKNWKSYMEATKDALKPRGVVRKAAQRIKEESSLKPSLKAIDIGCGTGRDSLYLLEQGFSVIGIDSSQDAITILQDRLKEQPIPDPKIEIRQQDITDAQLNEADLVCSSYTMPFIAPDKLETTWKKIEAAIPPGGYFAGHFFGTEDDWAKNASKKNKMNFFTGDQINTFFQSFDLIQKKERKFKEPTADKTEDKNWHTWNIIARKR